jgi:hypothetical protein
MTKSHSTKIAQANRMLGTASKLRAQKDDPKAQKLADSLEAGASLLKDIPMPDLTAAGKPPLPAANDLPIDRPPKDGVKDR